MIFPPSFYVRSTVKVARDLLGQILTHETEKGIAAGKIVEVEAYLPKNDPGATRLPGKTPRNAVLFGPPGFSYVYFCYGNHYLFNVVTEREGTPGGILIRALEPVKGMELMAQRRNQTGLGLSNGPGKLTQALGISRRHNQIPVWKRPLSIQAAPRKETVGVTTRIGITEGWELPLRFYLKENPYLSVKPGQDRPSPGRKKQMWKERARP